MPLLPPDPLNPSCPNEAPARPPALSMLAPGAARPGWHRTRRGVAALAIALFAGGLLTTHGETAQAKPRAAARVSSATARLTQRAATVRGAAPSEVAGPLPPAVTRALAAARVPASSMTVLVERLSDGAQVLSYGASREVTPASTMKLYTTYAGLSILGPQYRWQTAAFVDGPVVNGVLQGNLYIQGTGDPKLVPEQLSELITQIRQSGINRIAGNLVLDKNYFDVSTRDLPPLDNAASAPYNVGPDALLYSFKALSFNVTPLPDGEVDVAVQPPLAQLRIDNTIHATRGRCTTTAAATPSLTSEPDGTLLARFGGALPTACGSQPVNLAVLDHTRFFAGGFLSLWQSQGGTFGGSVSEAPVPVAARLIALHRSPPLDEIVNDINKFSNNVMARNLYLTIGAVGFKPPATPDGSARVIARWMRRSHIANDGLRIENGSGLSRDETTTAASMVSLLDHAYRSPVAQPFLASLPIAGVDGTMRHRLGNSDVMGQAHIKTGTLSNVRAIAGYVSAANGQTYAVASFINDPRSEAARAAHDALLEWIYRLPA
ncbi:D-alanyl-D-alanine carboxypeptidase/D-alanyl-D-alanine endopeptidase [Chitinasiproducens palmae]|uniref:D-alanyl-D-alanine carboxypeptidase / D-alanyl-D-alanine-endopeptidase (Penicillin-binding protein 4) n=1 Tax=Chitinasiproducens palmae TaxID=1770053 RepID=A0A1H2PWC1_9BURK|nr:D-alanyl-D-alanine carboxypeptidase/D-alanyl-D-alanine-endopeptidase [Chitinasiproducens palmae]SDV51622.1 D-alanyl-D-alanine carboxypeptidase / D-alanyl-D-alanine-endopeptidase (penicillin-binding protein 4) [Chitinasiproducens palmae]